MEVEVISDHYDEKTGEIGELLLRFAEITPQRRFKRSVIFRKLDDWLLLRKTERVVQALADGRFGRRAVFIDGVRVKRGSLLITLAVFAGSYKFLKDYPDFRKGFLLLAADLREGGDRVERAVFTPHGSRTVDALSETARTLQFGPIVAGSFSVRAIQAGFVQSVCDSSAHSHVRTGCDRRWELRRSAASDTAFRQCNRRSYRPRTENRVVYSSRAISNDVRSIIGCAPYARWVSSTRLVRFGLIRHVDRDKHPINPKVSGMATSPASRRYSA